MGVYIKGITMPTSCDECRIMVFEDTNCVPELFCGCPIVFKAHPQGVDHRPDYCPLIEIPPHGRLIDADALMRKKIRSVQSGSGENFTSWTISAVSIENIRNAPTIIEAEEGET